jgi:hypothetical protein
MQMETILMLAQKQKPAMVKTVESISFNSNHVSVDTKNREVIKRRLKPVIVGHLQTLFETNRVFFPKIDSVLLQQLRGYRILGYNERGPRFNKTDEHFIDCLGLAAWAIFKYYDNPLASAPATKAVFVARTDSDEIVKKITRQPVVIGVDDNQRYNRGNVGRRASWGNDNIRSKF